MEDDVLCSKQIAVHVILLTKEIKAPKCIIVVTVLLSYPHVATGMMSIVLVILIDDWLYHIAENVGGRKHW